MGYRLELHVNELPWLQGYRHWRASVRDSQCWAHRLRNELSKTKQKRPRKPLERAALTFIRHSSSQLDDDNLARSFKPLRDLLQHNFPAKNPRSLNIIVNDNPETIVAIYRWEKCAPRQGGVTIIVEEIEEAA